MLYYEGDPLRPVGRIIFIKTKTVAPLKKPDIDDDSTESMLSYL